MLFITIVTILLLPSTVYSINCVAGYYTPDDGITCSICGPGTWSFSGATSCTQCPAGTSSAASGATLSSTCLYCAAGNWSPAGSSNCSPCAAGKACPGSGVINTCAAGKWSNSGATVCSNCAAGQWSTSGSGTCSLSCNAGSFCAGNGLMTTCGAGTWAASGASSCTNCAEGTFSAATGATTISTCANCPAGAWSTAGSSTCPAGSCPAGSACPGGGVKNLCAEGYWSASGATNCNFCPAGAWSTPGSSSCPAGSCPAGSACPGGGVKNTCAAGFWSASGATTCSPCAGGQYSAATGATSSLTCQQCGPGTWSASGSSSCTNCAEGKFSAATGASSSGSCNNCAAGSWSAPGSSSCAAGSCPAGSMCPGNGIKTQCAPGTWSAMGASSCTECASGKYSTATGATSSATCLNCNAGAWSSQGSSSCAPGACTQGYMCPGDGTMTLCAAGKFAPAGASTCSNCPGGAWSSPGAFTCVTGSCQPGSMCPGDGTMTQCAPGKYSAAGASQCSNCGAGTWSSAGSSSCAVDSCPIGSACPGDGSILTCPMGTFSTAGASSCTSCAAGTWSTAGSGICSLSCNAGSFCNGNGNMLLCGPGKWSAEGASFCTDCAPGTYSTISGATSDSYCTYCGAGFWSTSGASTCTVPCTAGYFCAGDGQMIMCPVGSNSAAGSSTCFDAPPVVTQVTPDQDLWTLGSSITIGGVFGSAASVNVILRSRSGTELSCANPTKTASSIQCTLPASIIGGPFNGVDYGIGVTVGDQNSSLVFGPTVFSISPSTPTFNTLGNDLITLNGTFGTSGLQVFIGSRPCINCFTTGGNTVICNTPAGAGAGLPVVVKSSGFVSAAKSLFSYVAPVVSSMNPPKLGFDVVQQEITITGKNFGYARNVQEAQSTVTVTFIDVAPTGNSTNINGTNVIVESDGVIKATLQSKFASRYKVMVTISGASSTVSGAVFRNYAVAVPTALSLKAHIIQDTFGIILLNCTSEDSPLNPQYKISALPQYGQLYQFDATLENSRGSVLNRGTTVTSMIGGSGQVIYVPDVHSNKPDSFRYTASVPGGTGVVVTSNEASVSLTVAPVNVVPEFSQLVVNAAIFDKVVEIVIPLSDFDEEDILTIKPVNVPDRGLWYTDSATTKAADFKNLVYRQPKSSNFSLYLRHDDKGGRVPYVSFELSAVDSVGATTAKNLQITVLATCATGEFINNWSTGGVCKACPTGAKCDINGILKPSNAAGYYRIGNGTFLECSPKEACVEGSAEGQGKMCAVGYDENSVKCGQCAKSYYRSSNVCEKCQENDMMIIIMVLLMIIGAAILIYLVGLLQKYDVGFIGILITYVQTLAVFGSFQLEWPAVVLEMYNALSILNFKIDIASPECFLSDGPNKSYEFKFIATLLLPFALLVMVLLGVLIQKLYNHYKGNQTSFKPVKKNSVVAAPVRNNQQDFGQNRTDLALFLGNYMFLLKLLYLSLASRALELFNCKYDRGTQLYYFLIEPSRTCYGPNDTWWWELLPYSIFAMIIYLAGIPLVATYLALQRARILKKPQAERTDRDDLILQITYKELNEFRDRYDYWEVVIMMRKLLIVMAGLFFTGFAGFQATLLIGIFVFALLVHKDQLPYSMKSLNFLETTTLVSSNAILCGGLLFLINSKFDEFESSGEYALGVIVVLIVVASTLLILYSLAVHMRGAYVAYDFKKKLDVNHEERGRSGPKPFYDTAIATVAMDNDQDYL